LIAKVRPPTQTQLLTRQRTFTTMLRTAFVLVCIASIGHVGHGRRFQRPAQRGPVSDGQESPWLASLPAAAFNPSFSASAFPGGGLNQMDRRVPDLGMNAYMKAEESVTSRRDISRRKMVGALLGVLAASAAPRPSMAAIKEGGGWKKANADLISAKAAALYKPPTAAELAEERAEKESKKQRYAKIKAEMLAEKAKPDAPKPVYCAGLQSQNQPMYVNMCDIVGPTKADQSNTEIDSFGNAVLGAYQEKLLLAKLEKEDPELGRRVQKMIDKSTRVSGY